MKPIWLLMMKWIEPPVRWPLRPERPKHSAITPWPANAASPWDQQRHDLAALDIIVKLILLGAHFAEHDGIDDFQMRRIGSQRQMDMVAVEVAI